MPALLMRMSRRSWFDEILLAACSTEVRSVRSSRRDETLAFGTDVLISWMARSAFDWEREVMTISLGLCFAS
jgi:hypothetical protein